MIVAGIDPGLNGAVVLLDARPAVGDRVHLVDAKSMADFLQPKGVKPRRINAAVLAGYLREWVKPGLIVVCEEQLPIPGMGAISRKSVGQAQGMIEGIAAGLGTRSFLVLPSKWQRILRADRGLTKERAIEMASMLLPEITDSVHWEANAQRRSGLADACCIALWGAREYGGLRFRLLGELDEAEAVGPPPQRRAR